MLVRDLGALCASTWSTDGNALVARLPKGSVAVVEGQDAADIAAALSASGPKLLQVFASALDAWQKHCAQKPDGFCEAGLDELSDPIAAGNGRAAHRREAESFERLLRLLARVRFVSAPAGAHHPEPGPPILLRRTSRPGALSFRPGEAWVRELFGPSPRIAKLPRSFLGLHARNDRYAILLGWYLTIMLRVNKKYGLSYHVRLRTMLEGAGIRLPERNLGRFLGAVYRGLERTPGVLASGPPYLLYAAHELLSAVFGFRPDEDLLRAYGLLDSGHETQPAWACDFDREKLPAAT